MEVDAFLILVLSVYVARVGRCVGARDRAARYAFVAAGWLLPWLRAPLPPRYWRKVVAAVQGVVLTVAAAEVLPAPPGRGSPLVAALALLAESFGRDVWWLWRHRAGRGGPRRPRGRRRSTDCGPARAREPPSSGGHRPRRRAGVARARGARPGRASRLRRASLRIPLEGLLVLALALVLPAAGERAVALLVGLLLGLLTILKAPRRGFFAALGRPFNPVTDWGYLGSGRRPPQRLGRSPRRGSVRRRSRGARRRACWSSCRWRWLA